MQRGKDWPQALSNACHKYKDTPHEWGTHDCVIFCAKVVEAMTGEDLIADLKGQWTTQIGAARVIKSNGFDSLDEMVSDYLPEKPLPFIGRGDIVICDGDNGEFIAVVMGHNCVAPGPKGLNSVPVSFAKKGFAIG